MRALIAIGVSAVMLAGCGQKSAFEELADGQCTSAQSKLIEEHISGQIDALARQDWKSAYSFASTNFQASVTIEQFTSIIGVQYAMLVENQGYRFDNCDIASEMIRQEVNVTSDGQDFNLTYELSLIDKTLGVESAVVRDVSTQLNA